MNICALADAMINDIDIPIVTIGTEPDTVSIVYKQELIIAIDFAAGNSFGFIFDMNKKK